MKRFLPLSKSKCWFHIHHDTTDDLIRSKGSIVAEEERHARYHRRNELRRRLTAGWVDGPMKSKWSDKKKLAWIGKQADAHLGYDVIVSAAVACGMREFDVSVLLEDKRKIRMMDAYETEMTPSENEMRGRQRNYCPLCVELLPEPEYEKRLQLQQGGKELTDTLINLQTDHLFPLSKKGKYGGDNCILVHTECNAAKSNLWIDDPEFEQRIEKAVRQRRNKGNLKWG